MPTTEHTDTTANSLPLRTSIIATIRKKIFSGEYPADCILSLTAVANEMNVSRTPVREAFQFLANEGLLELRPNRSAIVNGITDQYIR